MATLLVALSVHVVELPGAPPLRILMFAKAFLALIPSMAA